MEFERIWPYYPVSLDLSERTVVVVGGNKKAYRKIKALMACGGTVIAVAPVMCPEIKALEGQRRIVLHERDYTPGDLTGAFLAIAASESKQVNEAVYIEADSLRCLVNVADQPRLCNFLLPSTVARGDLQISVSTGGKAPSVTRRIRKQLKEEFGPEWEYYVRLMGRIRAQAINEMEPDDAADLLEAVDESDLLDRVLGGATPTVEDVIAEFGPTSEEVPNEEEPENTEGGANA